MKNNIKKIWIFLPIGIGVALILAGLILWLVMPQAEEEELNYSTSFDAASGTLTVSGTGIVENLYPRDVHGGLVWGDTVIAVDTTVRHLIIEEGITQIYNSFNDLHCLEDIVFPETLAVIDTCFMDCDQLVSLEFSPVMSVIRHTSFYDCDRIKEIHFSSEIIITEDGHTSHPFGELDSLTEIYIPGGSRLSSAFVDCRELKKAILGPGKVTVTDSFFETFGESVMMPFYGCHEDLKIYVTQTDGFLHSSMESLDPIIVSEEELLSMV